ncbi:hypothetical protein [Iningainema tapete]|uniref:Uncharacterized protein n=1 Tax=Iningainema tapete BLCC-T55 TaxID=2748662 RepID=A0A8J6XAY0_9CYAN|nr:hypothetical protein [Iningainema tapete]MBD2771174.1 hypothetical protein [Iningainema tapete BLCC-T55]
MTYNVNPKISIPSNWTRPKYQFGQRVKQGEIIGMEYWQVEDCWRYWVLPDPNNFEESQSFLEDLISPLSPEESRALIHDEIKSYQSKIAALVSQLKQIEGEG